MSPGQAGRERRSGESSSQVDGWMGGRGAMKKVIKSNCGGNNYPAYCDGDSWKW